VSEPQLVCGTVLYETPPRDVKRLAQSARVACETAEIACRFAAIDNSDRETAASFAAAAAGIAHAELHPHEGNIGFGKGHNRLMEKAFADGAEFYLGLNPDGFLHPRSIAAMMARSALQDDFALVEARQFPNEHPKIYDPESLITPWCSGACFLIPRRLHREIGGFDEDFFMYCEDVDYSWRARLSGAPCVMAADAFFFHDTLDRGESDFVRWHMALSMKRLLSKWVKGAAPLRLTTLVAEMLFDAPETAFTLGSKPGLPMGDPRAGEICDFRNIFGFAPFRWS
jgi:GT2 family glycosyltransferase